MPNFSLEGPRWATKTITWSFADPNNPTGSTFSGAIDPQYRSTIGDAIARWDDLINATFVQVPDTTANVDIRIGWGSFAGSEIGEAAYTYSGSSFLPGVTVRLEDPSQIPISSTPPYTYVGFVSTLYQVTLHELGHALGLDHSTDPNAVMYPVAGSSNQDLDQSDIDGIHALYAPPPFAFTDPASGLNSHPDGTAYTGSIGGVQQQFLYPGSDNVAISSSVPNVFIRGGPGDDAIAVASGTNLVDGGRGSSFLVGGTGTDLFFIDGSGGQATWSTIVNFHPGETATLWGWDASAGSTQSWVGTLGVGGYTGPTLDTTVGGADARITFANLSEAERARLVIASGTLGGTPYLQVVDPT